MLCRAAKKAAKAEKAAGRAAKKASKATGGGRVHMAMPTLRALGGRGRERNSLKNRRLFSAAPGGLRVRAARERQCHNPSTYTRRARQAPECSV